MYPTHDLRLSQSAAYFRPYPLPLGLTARQLECLSWVERGKSAADIGTILGISARTVEFHRAHVMDKLGARNMSDLVRLALLAEETDEQADGQVGEHTGLSEQPRAAAHR